MSRFDRRCDTEVHEVRRLEVINGEVGRRTWTAERKGEIVAESMRPGIVVSEVARRHNLTPQQLFAWRHDAKQVRLALPEEAMSFFVPVVAIADDDGGSSPASSAPAKGQIEIRLGTASITVPDDVQPTGHHRRHVRAPHFVDPLGDDRAIMGLRTTRLADTLMR